MNVRLLADNLAQRDALRRAQEWFSRSDPTILMTVLTVFGVILVGLLMAGLWQHIQDWRLEPARRQPMRLFRRLKRHVGLNWLDRWRLWRLAWKLQLPHPAALLISELFFDRCVAEFAASQRLGGEKLACYQAIREHLFGISGPSNAT